MPEQSNSQTQDKVNNDECAQMKQITSVVIKAIIL